MNALSRLGIAALAVLATAPSLARDRPGTPNDSHAGYCASPLREPPKICVQFQNTATEAVGFLMHWTENGQVLPSDLRGRSECRLKEAQYFHCHALKEWFYGNSTVHAPDKIAQAINPTSNRRFTKDREHPEGFRVMNLAYDSEYCFSFRSVDRYGVISGDWSGPVCARTPSPPGEPSAPSRPTITGLLPTSGAGVEGDGTPFKLLVEWPKAGMNAANIGWYQLEFVSGKDGSGATSEKYYPERFANQSQFEAIIEGKGESDPTERRAVRICAHNVIHKACSPAGWYYPFAAPKDRLSPQIERPSSAYVKKPNKKLATPTAPQAAERSPSVTVAVPRDELDALAGRGAGIAAQDALSAELRERAAEGPGKRGFDIGMATAEGQTQDGPGKQRVRNSLSPAEQEGYDVALAFSLQRNANVGRAAVGAAIANADVEVAEARAREPDVFYWLGFDIASGIFGDPAAGAQGNTATGPGSLSVRNALSPAAQRGFNASVALHLGRKYR
jgi:hypothetical protein